MTAVTDNRRVIRQLRVTSTTDVIGSQNVYRSTAFIGKTTKQAHEDAVQWVEQHRASSEEQTNTVPEPTRPKRSTASRLSALLASVVVVLALLVVNPAAAVATVPDPDTTDAPSTTEPPDTEPPSDSEAPDDTFPDDSLTPSEVASDGESNNSGVAAAALIGFLVVLESPVGGWCGAMMKTIGRVHLRRPPTGGPGARSHPDGARCRGRAACWCGLVVLLSS